MTDSNPTLKEMMDYAIKNGHDTDMLMDLWNSDRDFLIASFLEKDDYVEIDGEDHLMEMFKGIGRKYAKRPPMGDIRTRYNKMKEKQRDHHIEKVEADNTMNNVSVIMIVLVVAVAIVAVFSL